MSLIKNFARCWEKLRHGKPAPTRADFDLAKLKPFLPHLYAPLRRDTERINIVVGIACVAHQRDVLVSTESMTAAIENDVRQEVRILLARPAESP